MVEKGGKEELTDESPVSPNTFWGAVASCFDKCFTPNGRASRAEIWYFALFCQILSLISFVSIPVGFVLFLMYSMPFLMVKIRRLHDVNLSGWWLLLWLTGIGMLPLFYFLFLKRGVVGANEYGPDPYSLEGLSDSGVASKENTTRNPKLVKTSTAEPSIAPQKEIESIKTRTTQLSGAHDDERFYELVAAEFNDGTIKQGLWLKAETKARGNQDEARALYIEWRVGQLVESESELRKEAVRKQEEADAVREQEEAEAVRKQVQAENKRKQIEARAERERSQRENERTGRDAAIVFAIGIVVFIMIVGLGKCN